MKYHTHDNPLQVRCHKCHIDVTLLNQNVYDSEILCDVCYHLETDEEEPDLD